MDSAVANIGAFLDMANDHDIDGVAEINLNEGDSKKRTPLFYAIQSPVSLPIVALLVEKGGADVNSADIHGMTPLMVAVSKGHNTHFYWIMEPTFCKKQENIQTQQ